MRAFLGRYARIIVAVMSCAVATLPSCATMGGGGMKGMFADSPGLPTRAVSM
jgi:hypothetical protein